MYENIIHQSRTIAQLTRDIQAGQLPQSLLFHGPSQSGKLTAALETARVLSCEQSGAWNCPCGSCAQHRILASPGVLLLGDKSFLPEIDAAAAVLQRMKDVPRRYFYIRAVRKLLKRFEPVLWEGDESKIKGASACLEAIQDELELLYPGKDLPDGLEAGLKKIREQVVKLQGLLPSKGVPINMVRRLSFWARSLSHRGGASIIIEGAENLGEGARNSLLKILEEPPEGLRFLLLTRQKGAIMPTILSRVRPYGFQERDPQQTKDVLSRLFNESSGDYPTLTSYFQAFALKEENQLETDARDFLEGAAAGLPFRLPDLDWDLQFRPFLETLTELDRRALRTGTLSPRDISRLQTRKDAVQETLVKQESLNIAPALVLESLYYRCRS